MVPGSWGRVDGPGDTEPEEQVSPSDFTTEHYLGPIPRLFTLPAKPNGFQVLVIEKLEKFV